MHTIFWIWNIPLSKFIFFFDIYCMFPWVLSVEQLEHAEIMYGDSQFFLDRHPLEIPHFWLWADSGDQSGRLSAVVTGELKFSVWNWKGAPLYYLGHGCVLQDLRALESKSAASRAFYERALIADGPDNISNRCQWSPSDTSVIFPYHFVIPLCSSSFIGRRHESRQRMLKKMVI